MIRQDELIDKIKAYDPNVDEDLINRAYVFSMKAHGTQTRASGDPYFSHPLEVASILTEYKLDSSTIVTALLHDTVEDTEATIDEVRQLFGDEIARLVDGVTKLSQLESNSVNAKQAENFRKLVVAMSEDLRVLLVKLADRLHNMRTLHHITKIDKRKRIARETLEIYANLAERIGMRRIKEELQDISFEALFPEARESILNRLKFLREKGRATIEKSQHQIIQKLEDSGLSDFTVLGREKKPYSIWKKMESKNVGFEQLGDIIAYRITVNEIGDCYHALGTIHSAYHTVPGYFKDYISTPKRNGYQSLHTSVIGPQQQRIEIQIRTKQMHEIAEYGLAAHWAYKQGGSIEPVDKQGKQFRWIRELMEIVEQSANAEDFLENTKLEMYHDQVFCFTPKGDIMSLPRGATPVDFAYSVHSGIGNTTVGAKINGRIVPLKTRLRNGDQIEIINNKSQTPSPAWERFVVTGKARSEIRKFIRSRQRDEYINLGKALLAKYYKQETGSDLTDKILEPKVGKLHRKTVEDVYAEVGEGLLSRNQVLDSLLPNRTEQNKSEFDIFERIKNRPREDKKNSMPIRGLIPGMAIHYAGCCHPIPGDNIVGIVTTGRGVTIHTTNCDTLDNFTDTPERWIDVSWDSGEAEQHIGRLRASVSHERGGLASIANSIARDEGNISNFKIINRSPEFFEVLIDLEVKNVEHLNNIVANLRSVNVVHTIDRYQE